MDLGSEFTPPFRGDGVRSLADRLPACCFCSRRAPCLANVPTVGCPMLSVAGRGEARPRRSFAAHFETRRSARAGARFWLIATRMPETRCSIRANHYKFIDPDGLFIERAHDRSISMREWSAELLAADPVASGRKRCALLSRLTGMQQAISGNGASSSDSTMDPTT